MKPKRSISVEEYRVLCQQEREGNPFDAGYRDGIPWHCKSRWEANVSRVLLWLQEKGIIKIVEYEPEFIEFPVSHGRTRVMLDFRITELDGSQYWLEVRGRWKPGDTTKCRKLRKHTPEIWNGLRWIVSERYSKDTARYKLLKMRVPDDRIEFYEEWHKKFGGLVQWEK